MEKLLTVKEAGAILGMSTFCVNGLIKAGRLPRVKMGRPVRIRPRDLEALVEKCTEVKGQNGAE